MRKATPVAASLAIAAACVIAARVIQGRVDDDRCIESIRSRPLASLGTATGAAAMAANPGGAWSISTVRANGTREVRYAAGSAIWTWSCLDDGPLPLVRIESKP